MITTFLYALTISDITSINEALTTILINRTNTKTLPSQRRMRNDTNRKSNGQKKSQ